MGAIGVSTWDHVVSTAFSGLNDSYNNTWRAVAFIPVKRLQEGALTDTGLVEGSPALQYSVTMYVESSVASTG